AHCFWTDLEKQLPASQFAVALGKLSRQWGDLVDQAQKSDFQLNQYVLPVCIDFEIIFEAQQLRSGNLGKVAGWGLTAANGNPSPVLRVVELPFVELGTCFTNSPPNFRKFITTDKICAGTLQSDTAVCRGDSGGGLAFAETHKGTERYYLRGVVSTAPSNDDHCNTAAYTSFTQLSRHEHFVKQYWIES
ncbi:Pattern recognition serine proteinase, partial [Operophtera brumata]